MAEILKGIYALKLNDTVFYIGQSKDIDKRFAQHCSINQNRGNRLIHKWIRDMHEKKMLPQLEVVELTDDLNSREIYWISHFRSIGQATLNMADGGQTTTHFKRSTKDYPWAGHHSPVQRRLMAIKSTIRLMRKIGMDDRALYFEEKLARVNKAIRSYGLENMNRELWSRHGN